MGCAEVRCSLRAAAATKEERKNERSVCRLTFHTNPGQSLACRNSKPLFTSTVRGPILPCERMQVSCVCLVCFVISAAIASEKDPLPRSSARLTRHEHWSHERQHGLDASRQRAPLEHFPLGLQNLSLFVRMSASHVSLGTYENMLRPSMLIFWPWREAGLVVMLGDDPDILDRKESRAPAKDQKTDAYQEKRSKASEYLTKQAPFPRVLSPLNEDNPDIFAAPRARQQYAYFFADLYTSSEFVGLVDTDTLFITPVTPSSLFDIEGKPHVIGIVGSPCGWPCNSSEYWYVSPNLTQHFLRMPSVFKAMAYFPFIVKAHHLEALRRYVEDVHHLSFANVFQKLCAQTPRCSAFCVIGNYLWHFHRNEYAWHFQQNDPTWEPTAVEGQTDNWNFLTQSNTHPIVRVAAHLGGNGEYHFNLRGNIHICIVCVCVCVILISAARARVRARAHTHTLH